MKKINWQRVRVRGELLHVPVRTGEAGASWYFKGSEAERWWRHLDEFNAVTAGKASPYIVPVPPPPLPDTSGRVLTMAGVARLLGIPSAREARKFLKRNRLQPVKAGRKLFIQKVTVEDFIIGQEKAPTPAAVYARATKKDLGAAKLAAVERLDAARKSSVQA